MPVSTLSKTPRSKSKPQSVSVVNCLKIVGVLTWGILTGCGERPPRSQPVSEKKPLVTHPMFSDHPQLLHAFEKRRQKLGDFGQFQHNILVIEKGFGISGFATRETGNEWLNQPDFDTYISSQMSADAKPVWYTGIEWTRQIGAPTKQQSKIGYRYLDADPSVFHTPTNAHNPPTSDKESNIPVRHLVQQDLREETSEIQGVITGLEIVNYICRDGTNKMGLRSLRLHVLVGSTVMRMYLLPDNATCDEVFHHLLPLVGKTHNITYQEIPGHKWHYVPGAGNKNPGKCVVDIVPIDLEDFVDKES